MQLGRVPLHTPPIKAAHTPRRLLDRLWSLRCINMSRPVRLITSVLIMICKAERMLTHWAVALSCPTTLFIWMRCVVLFRRWPAARCQKEKKPTSCYHTITRMGAAKKSRVVCSRTTVRIWAAMNLRSDKCCIEKGLWIGGMNATFEMS